ncbi:hypothetical protein STTU_3854 [Streptomyces sp. Tu6071]|nr:hypothetical protein STTU_3854 [Streptomyces sp. Tu6071]
MPGASWDVWPSSGPFVSSSAEPVVPASAGPGRGCGEGLVIGSGVSLIPPAYVRAPVSRRASGTDRSGGRR